jgi:hypothetical protein
MSQLKVSVRFSGGKLGTPIVKEEMIPGSRSKVAKMIRIHGQSLSGNQACELKNAGRVSWLDHNGVTIEVSIEGGAGAS